MSNEERDYLLRLRALCEKIPDKFSYEIFYTVCKKFMLYKQGKICTKHVTKKELLKHLIEQGLLQYRYNIVSGKYDMLPDDRCVRMATRELLKNGFPILTTSQNKGFFIAESAEEVDRPQKENHSRAVAILAVDKGYKQVREFINGSI